MRKRRDLAHNLLKPIREEVYRNFWDLAMTRASACGRETGGDTIERARDFAVVYGGCLEIAAGEYADMIAQAWVARRHAITPHLRKQVIADALSFAAGLAQWQTSGGYLAIALGMRPEQRNEIPCCDTPNESGSCCPPHAFLGQLNLDQDMVLQEAERKITLRCLLSAVPSLALKATEKAKQLIAGMKANNPNMSQQEICARLDSYNDRNPGTLLAPMPQGWSKHAQGDRTWIGAYENRRLRQRVKKFISMVRPAPKSQDLVLPELPEFGNTTR